MEEIESRDLSLVAEQSKRRDMVRDFGTLKDRYHSLKSQYTYLIAKLEGHPGNLKFPETAVEEKKVKSHSSKRSHQGKLLFCIYALQIVDFTFSNKFWC